MNACDARILIASPRTPGCTLMTAACDWTEVHAPVPHVGLAVLGGKHTGTVVQWLDEDRRTFRGPLVYCPEASCCLPDGHRGEHAR